MERLRENISPALILSVVAVFISLGGGAYAALSANSVGTKQLKKNAVTAKKIKKDAVVASKIKAGSISDSKIAGNGITGAKIDEATLGQVPSALKADTATSANSAMNATTAGSAASATNAELAANLDGYTRLGVKRLTPSFSDPSFSAALAGATEVPLYELGQVTIYAKCFKTGTSQYGNMYIKTSVNGVTFDSNNDNLYGFPFLNVGTPESDREVLYTSSGPDSVSYNTGADPTIVLTPDGKSYQFTNAAYVKQGNLPSGDGPYGSGDACIFLGEGGAS